MREALLVAAMLVTSTASAQERLILWSHGRNLFSIEAARADSMIRWRSTAESPALSIAEAEKLAGHDIARRYSQLDEIETSSIGLHRITDRPEYSDLWYYVVMFTPPPFYRRDFGDDAYFLVVLMMDGSVVEPIWSDR